jgi:hypothetical protein
MNVTDFSRKNDLQIKQWIENHEVKKAFSAPLYRELLDERARREESKSRLSVDRSLQILQEAARLGQCTSYGDLAKASGVEWSKARLRMNGAGGHLDQLLDVCHVRALPLLTAICVNKSNVESGELDQNALTGFAVGARRLGYSFTDEIGFHRAKRDECWAWGRGNAGRA